jgi:isopentenyl-diphosphate delta-isomerase
MTPRCHVGGVRILDLSLARHGMMTTDFLDSLRPAWCYDSRSRNALDQVLLVDAADQPIGTIDKLRAHEHGLRHRAVSVIVRDSRNHLLLQQRASGKYHSAGLWSNACCSHPRPGETVIDAARRRLREEMGITSEPSFLFRMEYRAAVSDTLVESEIVHVYEGRFDGIPDPDPAEVRDWRWIAASTLADEIELHPERYTVWFRAYVRQFKSAIVGQ